MSAYVIVEFTIKDPKSTVTNTAPLLGRRPKSTEARLSPTATGKSCTAMPRSLQEHSCGLLTVRRHSGGTTRLSISS